MKHNAPQFELPGVLDFNLAAQRANAQTERDDSDTTRQDDTPEMFALICECCDEPCTRLRLYQPSLTRCCSDCFERLTGERAR